MMGVKIKFAIITILSLYFLLFSWLFVNSITLYNSFDIQYSELVSDELTFNRCEVVKKYGRRRWTTYYLIYFEEYDKPFEISPIVNKEINKKELEKLTQGITMTVFYRDSNSKKYQCEICEMKTDSISILTLSDYVRRNQNNQIVGICTCPIMISLEIILIVIFIRRSKYELIINNTNGSNIDLNNLGKLKIKYKTNNKVVKVYILPGMCSLVIDDIVVDKYVGYIFSTFYLQTKINENGRVILIEAIMGEEKLKLYYDGKLVKKRFVGLG